MPFDAAARLTEWRKSLLDTTKRNRLIKFVAGRVGGVNLLRPTPTELWARLVREGATLTFAWKREILGLPPEILDAETLASDYDPVSGGSETTADEMNRQYTDICTRSPRLMPTHLLTEFTDRQLAARLTHLFRTAREAETDHGVTTLFVAFGFLKWFESADSAEELLSPLLLVPVRLRRETVESAYSLAADEDDVLPNHCLAELLRTQFRIKLPTAAECPLDLENPECLPAYLRAVEERVKHVPRWGVVDAAALGVFNFQKLAMWEDLGQNGGLVMSHPLCQAIAGDASVMLKPPPDLPTAVDLDRVVPPDAAVHILDADSSQHEAIEAVKRGAHLVMDGPPGTGKSQTIANMIAATIAAGKTVLFVSEKTAALEVVKRRLDRCGLGDFCLELHSHKANKKQVVTELGRCLELTAGNLTDLSVRFQELTETRRRLNEFVAELHLPRHPLGWSAFRIHGELARLDRVPGRSRLMIPDVALKDAEYVRTGGDILARLADCGSVLEEPGGHPWRGCKVTVDSHAARDDAEYVVGRLSDVAGPAVAAALALAEAGFAAAPVTAPAWRIAEADARRVLTGPEFPPEWFRGDPRRMAEAVIGLDEAAREARDFASTLPEFDLAALREITDATSLAALTPEKQRLALPDLPTRKRAAALKRVEEKLRTLAGVAAEIDPLAGTTAGLLLLPRTPTADQLGDLAAIAAEIADGPPIPPAWWEAEERAYLLDAIKRGSDEERQARSLRAAMSTRLAPAAFEADALELVLKAERHATSFWRRLLPRWKNVKSRIVAWYTGEPPTASQLRADIVELAAYHRLAVSVRQVAVEYAADLCLSAEGKPDWEASAARVRAVNWLEEVGARSATATKTSFRLRRPFDRPAIGDISHRLTPLAAALREGWSDLLTEFAVADPVGRFTRPASELASWLTAEAEGCRREAESLAVFVGALADGEDVPASLLPQRAAALRGLVEARGRIAVAAAVLDDPRPFDDLEGEDHSAEADPARSLLQILGEIKCPVTPPVVAAFTDPGVREKLAEVINKSETARRPFDKAWEKVTATLFDPDAEISTGVVLNRLGMDELKTWSAARAGDAARLTEWARYVTVEAEAGAFGVGGIIDEVKAGEFMAAAAADAFRARFYRLWLDALHQKVPPLAAFAPDAHERLIARFGDLDRLAIRATPDRLRNQLLAGPTRPRNREDAPPASELGVLLREANKKRRHVPLRALFRQIPSVLQRVKPCLMMSPLAVSTYLDTPELTFDLVIFDEASQVRPHDAICAIYRGRQLVVGGDPKQLPPTDFFTRTGEEGGDPDADDVASAGLESLLDVCLALGITRKRLQWHYRSRREGLIAFSNRYFYDGRLVTFPSADEVTGPAVSFVRVEDGRFKDGVNPIEARRVAAIVMEHAKATPDRSLGVIAFSQRQQDRILAEVESLRRQNAETEGFFADDREDPFFVKNLENVQGDERDEIILSVGYGPDDAGKVAMRFGPLNREGGERRLNVAVTRARSAMRVVSSMTAGDVDLSRTSATGAKLLKAFLDYAERGPVALAEAVTEADRRGAESPFEQEVGDELIRRGFTIHRQVGCGGYRIDLAIVDPNAGGKYLLGVECDGAMYHSAATARDRDRLRQAVLEGLGWRLVRVWSADWVRDRERQVRRILTALDAAKTPTTPREVGTEKLPFLKRRTPKPASTIYESIEVVSDTALSEAIAGALMDFGSMPAEDLITAVAKRLGFKRAGPKIRERVAEGVNGRISGGALAVTDDGRVRLVSPP